MALLENKSGNFVAPTLASGQAALASAQLPDDLIVWASDPEGKDSYPIVTYTWLLCYKQYQDKKKFEVLQGLLKYCLTDGQKDCEPLGYIPLAGGGGGEGQRRDRQHQARAERKLSAPESSGMARRTVTAPIDTDAAFAPARGNERQISRPPTSAQRVIDQTFRGLCYGFAWLSVLLVVFIVLRIAMTAVPAVRQYGLRLPYRNHLGPQPGPVRHPPGNLGHAVHFLAGPGHRNRLRRGGGACS